MENYLFSHVNLVAMLLFNACFVLVGCAVMVIIFCLAPDNHQQQQEQKQQHLRQMDASCGTTKVAGVLKTEESSASKGNKINSAGHFDKKIGDEQCSYKDRLRHSRQTTRSKLDDKGKKEIVDIKTNSNDINENRSSIPANHSSLRRSSSRKRKGRQMS